MNEDEQSEDRERRYLLRLLDEARDEGGELAESYRQGLWKAQQTIDLAHATADMVNETPSRELVARLVPVWETGLSELRSAKESVPDIVTVVSSTGNTVAYRTLDVLDHVALPAGPDVNLRYSAKAAVVRSVVSKGANEDRVSSLLVELGLDDAAAGQRSALALFKMAHRAYDAPVSPDDPATTSLLPIREAINTVVETLLRRRPQQEQAKNEQEKIKSILRQVGRSTVTPYMIDQWAGQWSELNRLLSDAKQRHLDRTAWRGLLDRATLFLDTILGAIEPASLRG